MAILEQSFLAQCTTEAPGDRPFQCLAPGCGRRFNRKFTLTEHIKTHTGARPFVCPEPACAKRFSRSGNLSRHKRLHSSIKPFECSVPLCTRTFSSEAKLQRYLRMHSKGRCYTCMVAGCNKSYSTTGNLTRHMKNHHDFHQECTTPTSSSSSSSCPTTPVSSPIAPKPQQQSSQPLMLSVSTLDGNMTPLPAVSVNNSMAPCTYEPITSLASSSDMVDFLRSVFSVDEDTYQSTDSMLLECATPAIIDDVVHFELGHVIVSDMEQVV